LGQKNAALYCRVSTVDQSCERQERELLAYAKRAEYNVVGVWKETAPGGKDSRPKRKQVMAMAQARQIDVILVSELTRWGRSMLDLVRTLQDLQAWDVSLVALAEFERDLLRERVRSGIAAARARGVQFGRRPGQRIKADRVASKVLALVATGHSYRQIGRLLDISKNTVLEIVKRAYAAQPLGRGRSLTKAKS